MADIQEIPLDIADEMQDIVKDIPTKEIANLKI